MPMRYLQRAGKNQEECYRSHRNWCGNDTHSSQKRDRNLQNKIQIVGHFFTKKTLMTCQKMYILEIQKGIAANNNEMRKCGSMIIETSSNKYIFYKCNVRNDDLPNTPLYEFDLMHWSNMNGRRES